MNVICQNLQAVHDSIAAAAGNVSRDVNQIKLLAVSKTFGPEQVIAAAKCGQTSFGENYLQEALDKMQSVRHAQPGLELEWHFIGPVQSNKTRQIAENFDWVHSVEREKIAQRLSDQRPPHLPPLNVCLQINISGEASKSGVMPEHAMALAHAITGMPHLKLRGLMAIPEPSETYEQQCVPFRQLKQMFEQLRSQGFELDTLSIGMSADMAAAIAEGATVVRIGTAIFGKRDYAE